MQIPSTMPRLLAHLVSGVCAVFLPLSVCAAAAPPPTITKGQLTVAYRTDDKPISFIQNGTPAGFLVDFEQAIGAQLGLKVQFVSTGFASMLPAVKNHIYDTAAFAVIVTPQRSAMVDFTTPIGYGQARLVTRAKDPIATVQAAAGKVVAVTQGSALIPLLAHIAPGVQVKEFPNVASSLNALIAGQVEGLFTGLATADSLVKKHPGLGESQIVTSGVTEFPIAKSNPALREAMNAAIAHLMKDGTFTKLFVKWNPPAVRIPAELYADYPGMPQQPAE
jgi:polar amino acid transport system substrate-binding protein